MLNLLRFLFVSCILGQSLAVLTNRQQDLNHKTGEYYGPDHQYLPGIVENTTTADRSRIQNNRDNVQNPEDRFNGNAIPQDHPAQYSQSSQLNPAQQQNTYQYNGPSQQNVATASLQNTTPDNLQHKDDYQYNRPYQPHILEQQNSYQYKPPIRQINSEQALDAAYQHSVAEQQHQIGVGTQTPLRATSAGNYQYNNPQNLENQNQFNRPSQQNEPGQIPTTTTSSAYFHNNAQQPFQSLSAAAVSQQQRPFDSFPTFPNISPQTSTSNFQYNEHQQFQNRTPLTGPTQQRPFYASNSFPQSSTRPLEHAVNLDRPAQHYQPPVFSENTTTTSAAKPTYHYTQPSQHYLPPIVAQNNNISDTGYTSQNSQAVTQPTSASTSTTYHGPAYQYLPATTETPRATTPLPQATPQYQYTDSFGNHHQPWKPIKTEGHSTSLRQNVSTPVALTQGYRYNTPAQRQPSAHAHGVNYNDLGMGMNKTEDPEATLGKTEIETNNGYVYGRPEEGLSVTHLIPVPTIPSSYYYYKPQQKFEEGGENRQESNHNYQENKPQLSSNAQASANFASNNIRPLYNFTPNNPNFQYEDQRQVVNGNSRPLAKPFAEANDNVQNSNKLVVANSPSPRPEYPFSTQSNIKPNFASSHSLPATLDVVVNVRPNDNKMYHHPGGLLNSDQSPNNPISQNYQSFSQASQISGQQVGREPVRDYTTQSHTPMNTNPSIATPSIATQSESYNTNHTTLPPRISPLWMKIHHFSKFPSFSNANSSKPTVDQPSYTETPLQSSQVNHGQQQNNQAFIVVSVPSYSNQNSQQVLSTNRQLLEPQNSYPNFIPSSVQQLQNNNQLSYKVPIQQATSAQVLATVSSFNPTYGQQSSQRPVNADVGSTNSYYSTLPQTENQRLRTDQQPQINNSPVTTTQVQSNPNTFKQFPQQIQQSFLAKPTQAPPIASSNTASNFFGSPDVAPTLAPNNAINTNPSISTQPPTSNPITFMDNKTYLQMPSNSFELPPYYSMITNNGPQSTLAQSQFAVTQKPAFQANQPLRTPLISDGLADQKPLVFLKTSDSIRTTPLAKPMVFVETPATVPQQPLRQPHLLYGSPIYESSLNTYLQPRAIIQPPYYKK